MTEPDPATRLDRAFFARSTLEVARSLIGCVLIASDANGSASGRIVEAEAYLGPDDPASHAARLKQGRVTSMWGPPGIAYVYRSHGIHAMLNAVCEPEGSTGAVLIRALEPLSGVALMRLRRGLDNDRLLCSGPGRLCQALGIILDDHGLDLVTSDRLWIVHGPPPDRISAGERIGISKGRDVPWRFFETESRYVSAHRRGFAISD